ncbi:MAG: MBL fold metallo-hydrolase, partial [Desulforhabdus sp.]|nr:MBL fold metallo-hydrolase [Desulforhabdus sp.]
MVNSSSPDALIILLNSPIGKDAANRLLEKGWLPAFVKIIEAGFPIQECLEATLGLDLDAVSVRIGTSMTQARLIMTQARFSNGDSMSFRKELVACSASHWGMIFPGLSYELLFCVHALKSALYLLNDLQATSCEDKTCISREGYNIQSFSLCEECQRSLCKKGRADVAAVGLGLSLLFRERRAQVRDFFEHSPGQALNYLKTLSSIPEVNVKITEKVIESKAEPGSDIRNWLSKTALEVIDSKKTIKTEYGSAPASKINQPFLIAARRWNSWTPAQPHMPAKKSAKALQGLRMVRHATGGGYFISDGKTNLVVDPGYGYLEALYVLYGITVHDFDAVIVTHDHPDHSAELGNLLALRFAYRAEIDRPLSILMNPSSFYLYERLLSYHSSLLDMNGLKKMLPEKTYPVGDFSIQTVGMDHEEIFDNCDATVRKKIGQSKALGLNINGTSSLVSGGHFSIAIVGDTSFPKRMDLVAEAFGKPDIAAVHLGSIEEGWAANPPLNASEIDYGRGKQNLGKHLGASGCAKMIALLQPRLAVVTEFGEELDLNSYRRTLTDVIGSFSQSPGTVVLPSDVGLAIAIKGDRILGRCTCKKYVPVGLLRVNEQDGFL